MTKIDKKIIDAIDLLSKSMIKNNLSEIEISDGIFLINSKKICKNNNIHRSNEIFEQKVYKRKMSLLYLKKL